MNRSSWAPSPSHGSIPKSCSAPSPQQRASWGPLHCRGPSQSLLGCFLCSAVDKVPVQEITGMVESQRCSPSRGSEARSSGESSQTLDFKTSRGSNDSPDAGVSLEQLDYIPVTMPQRKVQRFPAPLLRREGQGWLSATSGGPRSVLHSPS